MVFTIRQIFHGFTAFSVDRTMRHGTGPDKNIVTWGALPPEEQKVWIALAFSMRYGWSDHELECDPTQEEVTECLGWVTEAWEKGQPS